MNLFLSSCRILSFIPKFSQEFLVVLFSINVSQARPFQYIKTMKFREFYLSQLLKKLQALV